MIKHIVMWNVRGDTPEEKHQALQFLTDRFQGLIGKIPGMLHLEIGADSSHVDYACDVVLYSEFESQQALDGYSVHPEHVRVKQELGNLRTERYQVDYVAAVNPGSESAAERASA